jgi:hypothetical protein
LNALVVVIGGHHANQSESSFKDQHAASWRRVKQHSQICREIGEPKKKTTAPGDAGAAVRRIHGP